MLTADKTSTLNGVTVHEYLLTKHNPNRIDLPSILLPKKIAGITVHNTQDLENVNDDAEQYTRATVNGNMGSVRVHYYVDDLGAWQNLPLTLSSWHAADGNGPGNTTTISIECIMSNSSDSQSVKAEDNCARLVAYLLNKYGLTVENGLFTHLHWINVSYGRKGTNDYLNTTKCSGEKYCPIYILPHWSSFKSKVQKYLNNLKGSSATNTTKIEELYRVRKSWNNPSSQIGAFKDLKNAKEACKKGYAVYNSKGKEVYSNKSTSTTTKKSYAKGTKITLKNVTLYASASSKSGSKISGTYWLYDGVNVSGRYRITNASSNVGKTPIGNYVTGFINKSDI